MAHIQVTIAGRSYRMACADGEERHLEGLASAFDARIGEMRTSFGEIGDMRLHVMAAITVADELSEARRRVAALEAEVTAIKAVAAAETERTDKAERLLADAVNRTASEVERLTARFGAAGGSTD